MSLAGRPPPVLSLISVAWAGVIHDVAEDRPAYKAVENLFRESPNLTVGKMSTCLNGGCFGLD